jgi:hypothetical protein
MHELVVAKRRPRLCGVDALLKIAKAPQAGLEFIPIYRDFASTSFCTPLSDPAPFTFHLRPYT